jgi:hypothetical protein
VGGVGNRRNVAQRIEELEALLGVTSYESEREFTYSDEEYLEVCAILREVGQLEAVLVAGGLSEEEIEAVEDLVENFLSAAGGV